MDRELTVLEHINELRKGLIVSILSALLFSVVAFLFFDEIIGILFRPILSLTESNSDILYVNSLFEGFITKLEISVISGVILTIPIHLFNIVHFILPGLKRNEIKIMVITLIVSSVFIVSAFIYGYYYIIPLSVEFLTGDGFFPEKVGLLLGYKNNIYFVLQLILGTLLIFQIPILLELLLILNVLKRKTLIKLSRYVIILIFIISAIVTPPDFISQLCVALPLITLYFLTLLIAKIFNFGREA